MSEENTKKCSKCLTVKLLSEFSTKNSCTAHRADCKDCYRKVRGITKRVLSEIKDNLKSCTSCGKFLAFEEFSNCKRTKSGLKSECKNCLSTGKRKINRQYKHGFRKGTPEHSRMNYVCTKLKISRKEYCENINDKRFQNKEKKFPHLKTNSIDYKRETSLRYNYNITLEDYNKMFQAQNGCCKICKRHQSKLVKRLCVDHNHETGEVRALLCHQCNTGIGNFLESTQIMREGADYLDFFNNKNIGGIKSEK